jgi:GntR family transcriptional regulator
MLNNWNDTAPIYRQLAQQLAGQLLDGEPPEGSANAFCAPAWRSST